MSTRDYVIALTDGTTTKTLTSSPFALVEYIPNPPRADAVDGLSENDTVSETCVVRVIDGSAANNIDEIRAIETLLDQGRKAQTDPSLARVYVTIKTAAAATEYRSEISAGVADYDPTTLGRAHWVNDVFLVKLFWTRHWAWAATTEVQLAVSNHLVTADTAGAPIHNPTINKTGTGISFTAATKTIADTGNGLAYFLTADTIRVVGSTSNDGTYTVATGGVAGSIVTVEALVNESAGASVTIVGALNNYLEIPAAQVSTIVNAPIRLELTNASGSSLSYKDIYVGISRLNSLANMVFTLEAEDGAGGTETANNESSGGLYNAITWAGDTETEVWTYTLSAAILAASRGAYFLPLARGGTASTTPSLRLNVKFGSVTVYEGALITVESSEYLHPLGTLQLPPYLERVTSPIALTLSLRAKKTGGGSLNLDFIQLVPLDGFRSLKQIGYAVPNGDTIMLDELFEKHGIVYGDASGSKYQVWVERGAPLTLQNNTLQRIYIMYDEGSTQQVGRKMTAKLYYRPRRLTL